MNSIYFIDKNKRDEILDLIIDENEAALAKIKDMLDSFSSGNVEALNQNYISAIFLAYNGKKYGHKKTCWESDICKNFFNLTSNIRTSSNRARRIIKIFASNKYNDFKSDIGLSGIFNYFIHTNFSSLSQKHWEYIRKLDEILDNLNLQNNAFDSEDNFELFFAFKVFEFYDFDKLIEKIIYYIDNKDENEQKSDYMH